MTGPEGTGARTFALRCRKLRKRFGSFVAVDGIDLDVAEGEIVGLLGPNGAGKTTTIRVLTTLVPPDEGSAEVFGHDVVQEPFTTRRLIGYVPQQLSADAALTGRENVALFTRLFDVPRRERKSRIDDVLDAMNLSDAADRLAKTYSGGMIRRLELAQALVNQPRLLVLDEPTIGLDPIGRDNVWERIHALRANASMTVLLTTHYMEEADLVCDRVALMHRGRIQAEGSPEVLRRALGPGATLEGVFRHHTGGTLEEKGVMRDVRSTRRTASRLG
jgi:ABC-2 type transport system ATP-binding protein